MLKFGWQYSIRKDELKLLDYQKKKIELGTELTILFLKGINEAISSSCKTLV